MSYPPPGDPNQPPQYPTGQPPQPQQPYGTPPSGYGYPPPGASDYGSGYATHIERPGVVTTASVIAIILSGLSALTSVALLIASIASWDEMIDEFRSDPDRYDMTASQISDISDAEAAVIVLIVVWLAIAVFGVFLGALMVKGHNWARITMTVFAALTIALSLLMIQAVIPALWLLGSIACIICAYVGGANDWFRYQKEQRRQPF